MKIRILGSHGGVAPGYQTSSYFINETFLIDCGAAASTLTPQQQFKIEDIFLTHPHMDHIKDIPFLIENSFDPTRATLNLRSIPGVLQDVHDHIFNDAIWPDFTKISAAADQPKYLLKFIDLEEPLMMGNVKVSPFGVNHPGHATGYLLEENSKQVIFTGDTGSNSSVWKLANQCANLKAIFTEITFPNRLKTLAQVSGHYTLELLKQDLEQLTKKVPIYISHFKPQYFGELSDEFFTLAPAELKLLHQNDTFEF